MALENKTLESFYTAADDDIIEAVTVKNVVLVFEISCAVEDGQHTNKTSLTSCSTERNTQSEQHSADMRERYQETFA